jgi:glycerol-3-phosphate acyltransferase PlsX
VSRIAIDSMGGDHAPGALVEGAVLAARETRSELILVGDSKRIERELSKFEDKPENLSIQHCSEWIEMSESPVTALRTKKDASILVGMRIIKSDLADAIVTAGNTGAATVASKTVLQTLEGVDRPAIAASILNPTGYTVVLDVGANVDSKPRHLLQFAAMGSVYARVILGVENPNVGLLSVGAEEGKGNELTKAAYKLFEEKEEALNFIGNVEGGDLFSGKVNVVVCDGFTGNIALKSGEALAASFARLLRKEFSGDFVSRAGCVFTRGALRRFKRKIDYSEHGAAPLLGVQGVALICHGHSSEKAIKNAIFAAERALSRNLNAHIVTALKELNDIQA